MIFFGRVSKKKKDNLIENDPRVQERIQQAKERNIYSKVYYVLVAFGNYYHFFEGHRRSGSGLSAAVNEEPWERNGDSCHTNPSEWTKKMSVELGTTKVKCNMGGIEIRTSNIQFYNKIMSFDGLLSIFGRIKENESEKVRVFSGTQYKIEAYIPGEWEKNLDGLYDKALEELPKKQQRELEERIEKERKLQERERESADASNPLKRDWDL